MNNILVRFLRLVLPRRYWYRRFYLRSEHWERVRSMAKILAQFECSRCGAGWDDMVMLDVHHKRYNLFNERLSDLEVLCRACHNKEHRKSEA